MAVRRTIYHAEGVYFITFTCFRWLPLIELVNGYDIVYKQFDILQSERHYLAGYVIMPNHVHCLVAFKNSSKSINNRIGTMKRFMAYEIVRRLVTLNQTKLLAQLSNAVNNTDRKRGKLHEVFNPSFDWKSCDNEYLIVQKLDYMHENPCKGKSPLADSPVDYKHSSAYYYITGIQGLYPVTNYMLLDDIM